MIRRSIAVSAMALLLAGCAPSVGREPTPPEPEAEEPSTSLVFSDFNAPEVPRNREGTPYPVVYEGEGSKGTVSITDVDAREGRCLRVDVQKGGLYLQWNPYDGVGRGFAREYAVDGAKWRFNTYNRLSFWIKRPRSASPLAPEGRTNVEVGTYVKRVADADPRSDESGGGHYYHSLNLPNNGRWTKVVLSMRPDHRRGDPGNVDAGFLPHPTGEPDYNYFDALTRFYIDDQAEPTTGAYLVDDVRIYQEPAQENDAQVYSLAGAYDPTADELIVAWRRPKDENDVKHEVRYAFRSLHEIGWDAATPAPRGIVDPPGWQGYNGMVYRASGLPLAGRDEVFVAIQPGNSQLFTQIVVPVEGGGALAPRVTARAGEPLSVEKPATRSSARSAPRPSGSRSAAAGRAPAGRRVDPGARRPRRPAATP